MTTLSVPRVHVYLSDLHRTSRPIVRFSRKDPRSVVQYKKNNVQHIIAAKRPVSWRRFSRAYPYHDADSGEREESSFRIIIIFNSPGPKKMGRGKQAPRVRVYGVFSEYTNVIILSEKSQIMYKVSPCACYRWLHFPASFDVFWNTFFLN